LARRRAIIIGGSMSGLLAGLLLRRANWSAEIFERETELAGRGAGIVAQPGLIAWLEQLGLDCTDLGMLCSTRQILDRGGNVTLTREQPQVLTAWERLYRLLRDAFPAAHYHGGKAFTGLRQDASGVVAQFADGESRSGDVLIAADGLRSAVRDSVLGKVEMQYAGYVAWRALLPETALPPEVHREVFDNFVFCLPPGEQFLGYAVPGPDTDLRPGHRRYNVIWYRPADKQSKLPWLLTDEQGVTHSVSIPPPLIRSEAVAEMRDAAERLLAPQFRAVVRQIAEPLLQPIYDLETPQMAAGRVAILGDAAFVARPHVAAGVSKAADDAAALVEALVHNNDIEAALKAFEAARLPDNCRIIERARHLGAYLQATRTGAEQAQAGQYSTDAAVIAETAMVDFLGRPIVGRQPRRRLL
jgi:2-polyprenyl-6-methoxyphenol hydroxylase-like FAD-dependent oxidoreductase